MQSHFTDHKDNLVNVTLFESYLSLFMVEHPEFYQAIYFKILDAIESFILKNRKFYQAERCLANIFDELNDHYPGCNSFAGLKNNFSLTAADSCIKHCAESFLKYKETDIIPEKPRLSTLATLATQTLFSNPEKGMTQINKHLRCNTLFGEKNRGVNTLSLSKEHLSTKDFGIVSADFVPEKLKNYYFKPVESARFTYSPRLGSYVENWLSKRYLPVIAGTSGSTEIMFSRVIPLVALTGEEIKILLLAQTASLIAMGHHSFFECMLVADRYGFKIRDTETLIDFYLQCIPKTIHSSPHFVDFLLSSEGADLLNDVPNLHSEDSLSFSESFSPSLSKSI